MDLITSSQDILYLAIAVCVVIFTFFVCWILYYAVFSVRNLFKITKEARDSVEKAHKILSVLKEKLDSTFSYIYLVEEGVKKISDVISEYKKKSTSKKKGSSSKKNNSKK